jgi:DNA-binding MarR family transcriptional regulator
MKIDEAIKSNFNSESHKATINILYTAAWINQNQTQFFKSFGLTGSQYNVLRILKGQHPTAVYVSEIINRMIDKASNASRIIDRLEKKQWAIRTICKKDRRQVDVTLTKEGLNILERIAPQLSKMEQKSNSLSDQELTTLNALLDKYRNQ